MAGCIPCFIIPLILFIFHRFIQPILLRYWNPWDKKIENKPNSTHQNIETTQHVGAEVLVNEEKKQN